MNIFYKSVKYIPLFCSVLFAYCVYLLHPRWELVLFTLPFAFVYSQASLVIEVDQPTRPCVLRNTWLHKTKKEKWVNIL